MTLASSGVVSRFGLREQPYAYADEICFAQGFGKLDFVNCHVRYCYFVRNKDELEFHYIADHGVSRVVHWGHAKTRFNETRNAQVSMHPGTSELTDPENEEKRLAGIDHEHPRIYDVVFQTNRKNGKVAIMDGRSNAFPYTDKHDQQ